MRLSKLYDSSFFNTWWLLVLLCHGFVDAGIPARRARFSIESFCSIWDVRYAIEYFDWMEKPLPSD